MAANMHTINDIADQTYRVAWFIGPNGAVPDASIVLHGGRLLNVQPSRRPNAIDLGDVAIVPGLVNGAHASGIQSAARANSNDEPIH